MSGLYVVSRIFVGILGFIALGGVVWFASTLGNTLVLAGLLLGFTSLVAAFVPQRKLSSSATQRVLVTLCVLGIGAGFVLVVDNLKVPREIEWDVVSINILHIAALATMAVIALKWPRDSAQ